MIDSEEGPGESQENSLHMNVLSNNPEEDYQSKDNGLLRVEEDRVSVKKLVIEEKSNPRKMDQWMKTRKS